MAALFATLWSMGLDDFGLRGYGYVGKSVCDQHFEDEALNTFIQQNADSERCDYCGRSADNPIAADMDEVMRVIYEAITTEYADANEELPYDSAEGGYHSGNTYDTFDLLVDEIELGLDFDSPLFHDIQNALGDGTWCDAEPFILKEDGRLLFSWDEFCRVTKHRSRFFFSDYTYPHDDPDHPEERLSPPGELLAIIGQSVSRLGMVRTLDPDKNLYRVRIDGQAHSFAAALGSTPAEKAKSANRMSPAGISMFYAAFDPEVAVAETYDGIATAMASIGRFRLVKPVQVVDLSAVPGLPSIFDEEKRAQRPVVAFLHAFQRAISQPIERDGSEHVGYAPTQVLTEYFRYVFRHPAHKAIQETNPEHEPIQGIIYSSAKARGERALVLFFDHTQCGDASSLSDQHWIALQDVKHQSLPQSCR